MIIYLWAILVLNAIGIIVTPWAVGRERKPLTPMTAGINVAAYLMIIVFATVALLRGWGV